MSGPTFPSSAETTKRLVGKVKILNLDVPKSISPIAKGAPFTFSVQRHKCRHPICWKRSICWQLLALWKSNISDGSRISEILMTKKPTYFILSIIFHVEKINRRFFSVILLFYNPVTFLHCHKYCRHSIVFNFQSSKTAKKDWVGTVLSFGFWLSVFVSLFFWQVFKNQNSKSA